jgi:hypothetical protein
MKGDACSGIQIKATISDVGNESCALSGKSHDFLTLSGFLEIEPFLQQL